MSINDQIDSVESDAKGFPGTNGGEAAASGMRTILQYWQEQEQKTGKAVSLASMEHDLAEFAQYVLTVQQDVLRRLQVANAHYMRAAREGNTAELEAARIAGANVRALHADALLCAVESDKPDYAHVRTLLLHQYGEKDLGSYDCMAVLGHSLGDCVKQVQYLAANDTTAQEKGIALPDLFNM